MTPATGPSRLSGRPDRPPRTWDSTPAAVPRHQGFLVTLAGLLGMLGLTATALRVFPPSTDIAVLLASFSSYGTVAYAGALALLLVATFRVRRRAMLAAVCLATAVLLGCHLAWVAPLFVADARPAASARLHIASLNLAAGRADVAQLVDATTTADVVVLLETTPPYLELLERGGWRQRLRYAVGTTEPGPTGTAIYSRFPLTEPRRLAPTLFPQWAATVVVPGMGPVRVLAAHPCNPFCGGSRWAAEHQVVRSAALAEGDVPLVVAGDLNAVHDHLPLRQLRRDGLRSVADITGAGWLPTYPAGSVAPPTLPIDHILVSRHLTATTAARFRISGTDHLGLRAELAPTA